MPAETLQLLSLETKLNVKTMSSSPSWLESTQMRPGPVVLEFRQAKGPLLNSLQKLSAGCIDTPGAFCIPWQI